MKTPVGLERREFGRRDSSIEAAIVIYGRAPLACTIRNHSSTGCLLETKETVPPAHAFHLVVGDTGIDIMCHLRHRAPGRIGAAFVGGDVQRFVETFRPQPRMVAAAASPPDGPTPADALPAPVGEVAMAAAEGAADALELVPSPEVAPAAEPVAAPAMAPATVVDTAVVLADLVGVLEALPEFSRAGFHAILSGGRRRLVVYHHAVRCGYWSLDGIRFSWTAADPRQPVQVASSMPAAVHLTLEMMLGRLQAHYAAPRDAMPEPDLQAAG